MIESRAVFCFIGAEPSTSWTGDVCGFVLTDAALVDAAARTGSGVPGPGETRLPYATSVPGVFAAGDVRSGSTKRVASAVGEGAGAVASVHLELSRSRVAAT